MSVFISSTDEPTITLEDLHDAAKANNFTIESGSSNEDTFLMFANSFDSTCQAINDLPEYEDPRTAPVAVEGGERTYYRPSEKENPLNAWMYRTNLRSSDEKARKGPLAGKTIAVKDNMSVAGLPIGLGTSEVLFEGGRLVFLHLCCVLSFHITNYSMLVLPYQRFSSFEVFERVPNGHYCIASRPASTSFCGT